MKHKNINKDSQINKKDFKILFIYPNTMMATLLPLNISILSACLKKNGFQVKLFDTTYYKTEEISFEQKKVELLQIKPFSLENGGISFKKTNIYDDLKQMVSEYKPDLIAMTCVEDTFDLGLSLLKSIQDCDILTIVGGVYVNFAAEEIINNDCIDIICIGEGEDALVELCKRLRENEDYSDIKNLWVKKNGKIIKNKLRELADVNKLPYVDFDMFEPSRLCRPMHGKLFRMLHVELDRGCPFSCTYCEAPSIRQLYKSHKIGSYYRAKTADRSIDELKFLVKKYKPDYINFNAESYLAKSYEEVKEFGEKYIKEIGLPFWCQSRPETITEEKIKLLREMNVADMQFGVECGNEEFRKTVLKRHGTNKQITEGLKIVEKYKIPYTVNNIVGFPGETRELIFDTIHLNRQINPKTMNCYMFTPYKGTPLYEYCIEKGYLDKNVKPHQLLDGAPMKYDTITREELLGLQRTFSIYAKFPENRFDEIKIAEKFDEEGNKMFTKLRGEFIEKIYS